METVRGKKSENKARVGRRNVFVAIAFGDEGKTKGVAVAVAVAVAVVVDNEREGFYVDGEGRKACFSFPAEGTFALNYGKVK